ncbi:MAG: CopG family transcriptional regulator [Halobacteriales archaeon SW_9_67_25]|jgi:predicted transcriptional regulator|nr:MAG: CopG family transcriptional regulator [Halobacteriales archaeon SW_9_67_25]
MPTRFTVVCDDDVAGRVADLARQYDLTEEEVLRQLVELGLDEIDEKATP